MTNKRKDRSEFADVSRYDSLKERFMGLFDTVEDKNQTVRYSSPGLYSDERVTFIIPPVTLVEDRDNWKPSSVFIVRNGVVAVGRVFYTKTSGEYLIEELILRRGDIFGEFEVPLSLFGETDSWTSVFPPRFNMTYGAWASGPALNWSMAYPRYIPRDAVDPENAKAAVHPFYIKSKNIRPETFAEVVIVPIERFEAAVRSNPEAMTWFLMNVLKKNRLYFEPPTPGYGRSPSAIIARLIIRLLAHRIRHGLVVRENKNGKTTCRTYIGPTEWIKSGLGQYMSDIKEIVRSTGGGAKTPHSLKVFPEALADIIDVIFHYPVKDLDDALLSAMGCSPAEDRHDNRYGLLTGMRIECSDLDLFLKYLLEKGE